MKPYNNVLFIHLFFFFWSKSLLFFYDIVLLSATIESFDMVSFLCLPLSTVILVVKLFLLTVPESVSPNSFSPLDLDKDKPSVEI